MKYSIAAGLALCLSAPALAEADSPSDSPERDTTIVVVATGSELPLSSTGQNVSVIDAGELSSVQGPDLARALERLPGVVIARNGSLGATSALFVRGASSEQALVVIDGVRMNDVASPSGGYDLGGLMSGGIGRVELLRGSNSVIWGSQAIGGVLSVTSRDWTGVEASGEYGARDSFDGQVNAGVEGERYALNLGGGYTRTDGISSAASGTEPDGFRQWRASGRGRFALATGLSAELSGRLTDSRIDIDGYPAPDYIFADTAEYQTSRENSGRAGLDYTADGFELRAGYGLSETRRAYHDPAFGSEPTFATRGRSARADVMGVWKPAPGWRLDFGADDERTRFSTTFNPHRHARLSSAHALLGWSRGALSLAGGVRLSDHSRFGTHWTLGGDASLSLGNDWRLRASYGEGFKAPTLYQLFSEYGDRGLAPEKSRSYDFGIEKGDRNGRLHFALGAFRRDSRNLIDYLSCFSVSSPLCAGGRFGFYANVARARAQGVELELGAQVSPRLRASVAYTYLEAENRTRSSAQFGKALPRRPRHAVTVSADWETPIAGLSLGADLRMVSDSYDDAGNFVRIDGHALAALRASLPVNDRLELHGRIENVTDARYQTVAGYGTPGRSAFVGARARF